jgi:energy-coupling factor transport system ATP-binding protein
LVHDLGLTVLLAEHRLERVVQYADRVIYVPGHGAPVTVGTAAAVMKDSPVAPPVVTLGRWAGWSPLPLSVRDARREAAPLRERLAALPPPTRNPVPPSEPIADVRGLVAAYGSEPVLRGIDLAISPGEVVAVMGRNGAGKSTLLATLAGLRKPRTGTATINGVAPYDQDPRQASRVVGLVPQTPSDLLYAETVAAECYQSDRDADASRGTTRALLDRIAANIPGDIHPRDLSEGQRLALALSIVLAASPPVVLLDEPTRGLDYPAKGRLTSVLREYAARGHAVVVATHDVELAADLATRTIVLADGDIVADGPTREVVTHSPAFAPQVAKVLAPLPWLTLTDVTEALAG